MLIHDSLIFFFFFFQAEDGIRDLTVTRVQTCALPIFEEQVLGLGGAEGRRAGGVAEIQEDRTDRKSTRLNSSHSQISYAVFCLKKKKYPHRRIQDSSYARHPLLVHRPTVSLSDRNSPH